MRRIQFDNFEIDLDLFTLSKQGQQIAIGRRTFDLLLCLIQNRDKVADQELLRREVWQSATLSPAAIPTCILELRRALGDDAAEPAYIESVRGRGYRFISRISKKSIAPLANQDPTAELAFCGRSNEIETLKACAKAAIAEARGSAIVISGEAGIGKTRLLSEFLSLVGSSVDVLLSQSSNLEGTPPFWPWTQIVRSALKASKTLNSKLTTQAQMLSTVFPEIRGSVNPPSYHESRVDQFTIFSHWATTIRSMIGSKPLLLAFEDIHRADSDSLSLLSHLSRELSDEPVILVATHRPELQINNASRAMSEIIGLRNAVQIILHPLTASDVRLMLNPFTDDRDNICDALQSRTAGIPFYLTHLIRFLSFNFEKYSTESLVSVLPSNSDELVTRQLSDLPTDTRDTLVVASIEGERFSIQALANVLSLSPVDIIQRLQPAVRALLVREVGTDYVFIHTILRDALYQTIDSSRRRSIHLLLARQFIERNDSCSRSSQISDHLTNALPMGSPIEARRFAMLAGREAAERFAFARAQNLFDRAYRISALDFNSPLEDQCEILRALAKSSFYTGDQARARELLFNAASLARQIPSPTILAGCALDLFPDFLSIEVGNYDSSLVLLLEEAIAVVPKKNLALRARLSARLVQASQWSRLFDRREEISLNALRLARESGDADAILDALSTRSESLHGPDRAHDRLKTVVELGRVARRQGRTTTLLVQQTRLMACLLELGDIKTLAAENDRYRTTAKELCIPQYRWYPGATDTMLAMLHGNIEQADRLASEYKPADGWVPDQNFLQAFACQHVVREIERDRSIDTLRIVREFANSHKYVYSWSAALAWLQWDAGYEREARTSLQEFGERDIEAMAHEAGGGIGIASLAEVAVRLGDRRRGEYLYRIIEPISDLYASGGYGIAYFGSFSRYAGLLSGLLGDRESEISYLQKAIENELSIGARTWACYAYLDFLVACNQHCRSSVDHDKFASDLNAMLVDINLPRLNRKYREAIRNRVV
jgi:DNA-binding winged helix-turn-helix (wHTH) protein